jgi:hypothetical protein
MAVRAGLRPLTCGDGLPLRTIRRIDRRPPRGTGPELVDELAEEPLLVPGLLVAVHRCPGFGLAVEHEIARGAELGVGPLIH